MLECTAHPHACVIRQCRRCCTKFEDPIMPFIFTLWEAIRCFQQSRNLTHWVLLLVTTNCRHGRFFATLWSLSKGRHLCHSNTTNQRLAPPRLTPLRYHVWESSDSATHEDGLIHVLLLCKHKLPNSKVTRELLWTTDGDSHCAGATTEEDTSTLTEKHKIENRSSTHVQMLCSSTESPCTCHCDVKLYRRRSKNHRWTSKQCGSKAYIIMSFCGSNKQLVSGCWSGRRSDEVDPRQWWKNCSSMTECQRRIACPLGVLLALRRLHSEEWSFAGSRLAASKNN